MKEKKASFSGKIGFIMAAAGSAVGVGNLWRFPYLAAKYGGGIFILVYILLAVTFGFSLMIMEIAIGRKTKSSCMSAYKKLNQKFAFLGPLSALVPILILPFYCVIGGWVLKYLFEYILGHGVALTNDAYFTNLITVQNGSLLENPVLWFSIFIIITAIIVMFGVQKGVESVSKVMMPVLIVISVVIAIYSLTIPGAIDGVKYYLIPDFSKFSISTILGACGQMFFSMSLAMGIMITYGSYVNDEDDLEKSVSQIELIDTGVALLAGLMIIPPFVAFNGGNVAGIEAGPGLMFEVLPKVFDFMPFGGIVGLLFFTLVFFATITSSISLLETCQDIIADQFKISRKLAIAIIFIFSCALGTLCCLGYGPLDFIKFFGFAALDFFDVLTNSILMPIVALISCIFVGHVLGLDAISEEVEKNGHKFGRKKLVYIMIKYIAPILLAGILIVELLKNLGIFVL